MTLVCTLLCLTLGDVIALGDDGFARREAAEARLRAPRPLSWPASRLGLLSPDLEVRTRSKRLCEPCDSAISDGRITLIALWFFYGPDELQGEYRRCVGPTTTRIVRWLGAKDNLALSDKARAWGLLPKGGSTFFEAKAQGYYKDTPAQAMHWVGWVNVARWKVVGVEVKGQGW